MIKFIHKKHVHSDSGKIIIYYNALDIFLGVALMILVVFFIHDYLSHALATQSSYNPPMYLGQLNTMKAPIHKTLK